MLLTGAGLLLRSFIRLINVEPGFDTANLLVFLVQLPDARYKAPGSSLMLFEELDALVEGVPGVRRATFSEGAPPTGGSFSFDIQPEAEGQGRREAPGLMLPHSRVAPDYFATMGIPLVEGRTFARDDPEDVVVVNDLLARRFWGTQSPVGRRFRLDPEEPWHTVVGVARDVKQMGLNDPMGDGMEVYFPYARATGARFFTFMVRVNGDEAAVVRQVKERLWSLDARLPVIEAATMDDRLGESVARPRFILRLVSAFAGIALLLAGVGVYGTAAYWVARRRRELGIRMALGATPRAILALVVGRSVRLAAWGCAIGLMASLAVTRVLGSLMFETSPREPADPARRDGTPHRNCAVGLACTSSFGRAVSTLRGSCDPSRRAIPASRTSSGSRPTHLSAPRWGRVATRATPAASTPSPPPAPSSERPRPAWERPSAARRRAATV